MCILFIGYANVLYEVLSMSLLGFLFGMPMEYTTTERPQLLRIIRNEAHE